MNKDVKDSLKKVIDYLEEFERTHFEECEETEKESHILNDIVVVRKWLESKKEPIKIEVSGGLVTDVKNIPEGYEYEIMDHDIKE